MVATALVIRATGTAHPADIAGSGVNTRVGSLSAIGSRPARKPLVMRDVPTGRSGAPAERTFSFGPFCLHPTQRLLFDGEEPLHLGSRAMDILIALLERPGELVSKRELIARVWPNTIVVEANLTVHVAALRRALGDGEGGARYVLNIPGRGYRFVAPVKVSAQSVPTQQPAPSTRHTHNLPAAIMPPLGRAETIGALTAQLSRQRLLTVVGPGGMGKTSVALAVAEALIGSYEHGVCLLDLAPLEEPTAVSAALASALGLAVDAADPLRGLIAALRDRQMLLVLDNCECRIEPAAALAVEILQRAPGVQILATSREPLRAQGEGVHRLASLRTPLVAGELSAVEILGFPAVQLFVERATAIIGGFQLSDRDAAVVADICSRLDGNPLAIELAAAQVGSLGLRGLAACLSDRMLASGTRRTVPRHQTMRATLDWSHELLSQQERVVLRRLAIFAGSFAATAAGVVGGDEIAAVDVVDRVANLVSKSLVTADLLGPTARYRLPDITRAYALEKLIASGEFEEVDRRHQQFLDAPEVEPGRVRQHPQADLATPSITVAFLL